MALRRRLRLPQAVREQAVVAPPAELLRLVVVVVQALRVVPLLLVVVVVKAARARFLRFLVVARLLPRVAGAAVPLRALQLVAHRAVVVAHQLHSSLPTRNSVTVSTGLPLGPAATIP